MEATSPIIGKLLEATSQIIGKATESLKEDTNSSGIFTRPLKAFHVLKLVVVSTLYKIDGFLTNLGYPSVASQGNI